MKVILLQLVHLNNSMNACGLGLSYPEGLTLIFISVHASLWLLHDGSYLPFPLLVSFYIGDNTPYPSVSGPEMFWCVLRDFILHVDPFCMSIITCFWTGFVFTCPEYKSGTMELW